MRRRNKTGNERKRWQKKERHTANPRRFEAGIAEPIVPLSLFFPLFLLVFFSFFLSVFFCFAFFRTARGGKRTGAIRTGETSRAMKDQMATREGGSE
jgi:ABC-type multidrug transport system permease subunit